MLRKIHLSYNFDEELTYTVEEGFIVNLSDGTFVNIPKGFKTDGSSSPWYLRWLFPPIGGFIIAAVVHDYLYNVDKSRGKKFADKEMLRLSDEYNDENIFKLLDNYLRYLAVRLGGLRSWKD